MYDIESPLLHTPVFKRIDNAWIGLLVLGIFISVSSLITLIALCFLWRRQQQCTQFNNESYVLSDKPNGNRRIGDHQPKSYETQKMEVFVPQGEEERTQQNLGEIHAHFTPEDGIQQMHQFYQRTSNTYF